MNKANRRRYRLHSKLKGFISLKPKLKTVYVTDEIIENLKPIHRKYVNELKNEFNYNIQYQIPVESPLKNAQNGKTNPAT